MRDRGRAGVDGHDLQLDRHRAQNLAARERRQETKAARERRADETLRDAAIMGEAPQRAAEAGMVENEGDAEQRHALPDRPLEHDAQVPAARAGRLEQRLRAGLPQGGGASSGEQRRRASVQNGLRRRQRDDEAGLQQQRIHLEGNALDAPDLDQSRILDVVHLDAPVEATRQLGCAEPLALAPPGFPLEPAGDEERLPLGRNPEPLQLVHDSEQRLLTRIGLCRGNRE